MKRLSKVLVLGSAVTLAVALSGVMPAGATPPTGYGFDNTAHVIVGGGSDTTYKAMINLTDLYDGSPGCNVVTANGATLNNCIANGSPETNTQGNYQHDTVAQANPVGSGAGITAMIGGTGYNGTVSGLAPNFARSSRGPSGSELASATFWGYAQDGIQVVVFNARNNVATGADPVTNPKMSPDELMRIWNCTYTNWNQIPSLNDNNPPGEIAPTPGPIVPWGVNSSSGTFATFRDYIRTQATDAGHATFDPNAGACVRKLQVTNAPPFENDIKPLINDPAVLSNSAASTDNPENWIWWGSFGELSTFPFKGTYTRSATTFTAFSAPVLGITPNAGNIAGNTYPIGRTLYHVTKNTEADCPQTVPGTCDFPGNLGPVIPATGVNDLNVTGATSGTGGAVREFTRWLCRAAASQQTVDPYTGTNYNTGIGTAIIKAGYTTVPTALKTSGSRCSVLT